MAQHILAWTCQVWWKPRGNTNINNTAPLFSMVYFIPSSPDKQFLSTTGQPSCTGPHSWCGPSSGVYIGSYYIFKRRPCSEQQPALLTLASTMWPLSLPPWGVNCGTCPRWQDSPKRTCIERAPMRPLHSYAPTPNSHRPCCRFCRRDLGQLHVRGEGGCSPWDFWW